MTPQDAAFEAEAIMRRVDLGGTVYMKRSTYVVGFDYTGYWVQDTRPSGDEFRKLSRDECALLVAGELQQVNRNEPTCRYLYNGVAGTLGQPNLSVPGYYVWRPCAADDAYSESAFDWVHISKLTRID